MEEEKITYKSWTTTNDTKGCKTYILSLQNINGIQVSRLMK